MPTPWIINFFFCTGNQIQDLVLARQALCWWVIFLAESLISNCKQVWVHLTVESSVTCPCSGYMGGQESKHLTLCTSVVGNQGWKYETWRISLDSKDSEIVGNYNMQQSCQKKWHISATPLSLGTWQDFICPWKNSLSSIILSLYLIYSNIMNFFWLLAF